MDFVQIKTPYSRLIPGSAGVTFLVPSEVEEEPAMLTLAWENLFPVELPTNQPDIDWLAKLALYAFEADLNSYRNSADPIGFVGPIRVALPNVERVMALILSNPQPMASILRLLSCRLAGLSDACFCNMKF